MNEPRPLSVRKAEYERLVKIAEDPSTPYDKYLRAMQDLHDLSMEGLW